MKAISAIATAVLLAGHAFAGEPLASCASSDRKLCAEEIKRAINAHEDFQLWLTTLVFDHPEEFDQAHDARSHCKTYEPNELAFAACLDGYMIGRGAKP